MGLADLHIKKSRFYAAHKVSLATDFFNPCLQEASRYDRATGYFSSSIFRVISEGFDSFVKNGGRMRLLTSPHLSEQDVEQILEGYQVREVAERAVARTIDAMTQEDNALSKMNKKALGYLGRLIGAGTLDVKLVLRADGENGIYHDKIGIFTDHQNSRVGFIGSNNETMNALTRNSESFVVFKTPDDDETIDELVEEFQVLWTTGREGFEVVELPEVPRLKLLEYSRQLEAEYTAVDLQRDLDQFSEERGSRDIPLSAPVSGTKLYDYQLEAISAWEANDGRGILKMATGTGKTVTAIEALRRKTQEHRGDQLLIIVLCPRLSLVDQWAESLEREGFKSHKCYESAESWRASVTAAINLLNSGHAGFEILVVTNSTFIRREFQAVLNSYARKIFLVADEAHNLGTRTMQASLPRECKYRLALSATPERYLDDEGTEAIFSYFGGVVYELGLASAIELGALSKYRYYPVGVQLDEDESERYVQLAAQIAQMISASQGGIDDDNARLGALLGERARLLGNCASKLPALFKEILSRSTEASQLIFCAEGNSPLRTTENPQTREVLRFLGSELECLAQVYEHETPPAERKILLEKFKEGDLQFLISMRCLDEGVDLPDARVAYLVASSQNPRQFIQRRGRILRRPADGSQKIATIIDFITLPPPIEDGELYASEQTLVQQELIRAQEFAALAMNSEEAIKKIRSLRNRYPGGQSDD